jgi:hypothetical protein
MSANRPFVLTIAGFDPSGGAEFWQMRKHLSSIMYMDLQ